MTESKKVWVEPELIVLVRHKPEEAVLFACKAQTSGDGAEASNDGCREVSACGMCTSVSSS